MKYGAPVLGRKEGRKEGNTQKMRIKMKGNK